MISRFCIGLVLAFGGVASAEAQAGQWIHCELGGLQVYSDLPEAETRLRLRPLQYAIADFELIWPTPTATAPGTILLVLSRHPENYLKNQPRGLLRDLEFTNRDGDTFLNAGFGPDFFRYLEFKCPPLIDAWGTHLIQRAFSRSFRHRLGERAMPWLQQGVGKLMQIMVCNPGNATVPALGTDPTLSQRQKKAATADGLKSALASGQFVALQQLFSSEANFPTELPQRTSPDGKPAPFPSSHNGRLIVGPFNRGFAALVPYNNFMDEAYEVVRFGLFGDDGRHRGAFLRFAASSANGPVDQATFEKFLGMDEATFLLAVWRDVSVASSQSYPLPQLKPAELPVTLAEPAATKAVLAKWAKAKRESFWIGSRRSSDGTEEEFIYAINDLF